MILLKVYFGVTVIVETMALGVLFATVKDGILPVPDAPILIAVFELVQVNTVFGIAPVKLKLPDADPAHRTTD